MKNEKLIRKAKKGNKSAFYKLIQQEKEKLYRMAFLYVKNENDALDIVQDTTIKAFTSIHTLKDPQYFSTWLTKIAINRSLDFLKKQKRVIPIDKTHLDLLKGHEDFIDERVDLIQAIDKLNEKHKTVIILKYYRDLSTKQIANILDCPEGTVKSSLHRALNTLKSILKEGCVNE